MAFLAEAVLGWDITPSSVLYLVPLFSKLTSLSRAPQAVTRHKHKVVTSIFIIFFITTTPLLSHFTQLSNRLQPYLAHNYFIISQNIVKPTQSHHCRHYLLCNHTLPLFLHSHFPYKFPYQQTGAYLYHYVHHQKPSFPQP